MFKQWIAAMAILLTLFHPELTESSSNYRNIPIKTVDSNAITFVFCPDLQEDENLISTSLHKGETELHSGDIRNKSHLSLQQFQVSIQNSNISYVIRGTEASGTGIYNCTIHTNIRTKTKQSILLIKDSEQPTELSFTCPPGHALPLSVGCGVVILYNLLITVIGFFLRFKLKNKELPENPYINTRPGEFR
ncbi:uncharacterized protein LOC127447470 isoform X2 [Myxocyprinus asiaticus]|uniref:uncharacterized protein LOC127447470 isoform X2 n=1 Tax=Myxocyprinus asiaticus TaxID=70543 RepID=UPI00222270BC|nr:uncharacterized protein LOC127447470 isoform X2 [Myxocyprinus asiaticus]